MGKACFIQGVAGWAGPEASRRHVRHASRRAGWHTLRPVQSALKGVGCAGCEQEVKAWPAWAGLSLLVGWELGAGWAEASLSHKAGPEACLRLAYFETASFRHVRQT